MKLFAHGVHGVHRVDRDGIRRRGVALVFVGASIGAPSFMVRAAAAQSATTSIIPRPASLIAGSGAFVITARTVVAATHADSAVAARFVRALAEPTGLTLAVKIVADSRLTSAGQIRFRRVPSVDTSLGDEGYRLVVTPSVVTITARAAAGAYYATQTLRQLLPIDVFRPAPADQKQRWTIPAVTVADRPRFAYRGMHLDVARHFMPKEFVEKYIDLLAMHKMNMFHWHLTDDQGWRIEIKKYPRLAEVGGWRDQTVVGHMVNDTTRAVFDGRRHGGFYTQDDVREVVAYAAERFVTIVPEIEMPGHSQAAIAAYPWLGNTGASIKPWTMWGVTKNILNPSDSTIAFMQDVLTEVMALFPGPYIHIGGDEAPKDQWKTSPVAQARMRETGRGTENELQSWFTTQMDAFLGRHGRRLVGWDEILEGGLAPNAIVMSWRGVDGGIAAARAGHDVVMTPGGSTYFDHYQAAPAGEPLAIGGFLPIDSVYAYEPVPAALEPAFVRHILGAQAQLWTEYIPDPKQAEYMAYPRGAALAEVLWSPKALRDWVDFKTRLAAHEARLAAMDVNFRR